MPELCPIQPPRGTVCHKCEIYHTKGHQLLTTKEKQSIAALKTNQSYSLAKRKAAWEKRRIARKAGNGTFKT